MKTTNLLFGIHAITARLQNNPQSIQTLYLQTGSKNPRLQTISQQAKLYQIPLQLNTKDKLSEMVHGQRHQGVVATVIEGEATLTQSLEEILQTSPRPQLFLVLDSIQDPHNLGACLRTANAAGACAVIATKNQSAPMAATARKVACGAAEHTPYIPVTNLVQTIELLQEHGVWCIGTAHEAQHALYQTDLTQSVALILGAEGKGLRRLTREHCDELVYIPMQGEISSLNVSVAAGVALFEAVRQRQVKR